MERQVYDSQRWRELPRTQCVAELLFGTAAGECGGLIGRHHVDKDDPESRTIELCQVHHPMIEAVLDRLLDRKPLEPRRAWRTCTHRHPYPGGKEACERRMNADLIAA